MKALTGLLLIVLVAAPIVSQEASGPTPEMELVRVELQRVSTAGPGFRAVPRVDPASVRQRRTDQTQSDPDKKPALHRLSRDAEVATESDSFGSQGSAYPTKFVASIVIRNTANKTVSAVGWEYLLFKKGSDKPIKRYQVFTKVSIAPGEVAELTKDVDPKGTEHQGRITRIEYSDGSLWPSPQKN